jgi:hypothetical protein
MTQKLFRLSLVLSGLIFIWACLTAWAQISDRNFDKNFGSKNSGPRIQILFKSDPLYNLDEQICIRLATVLEANGCNVHLSSYASNPSISEATDVVVFCANTYNWAPDWVTLNFILEHSELEDKMGIPIILGSGSTNRARNILEFSVSDRKMDLIGTEDFWLLKPNDDRRINNDNVKVALDQIEIKAQQWFDLIELKIKLNSND